MKHLTGRDYLPALGEPPAHWPRPLVGRGSIGARQAQLKQWLEVLT